MTRPTFFAATLLLNLLVSPSSAAERPNIVWIIVDDMSAHFSCYGETSIQTPNVDRLAAEGIRFSNAYVTAPVCSTCRSAFITGMYQTSIGAHHHRSGRGDKKITLPDHIRMIPELFQEAGYHTSITGWPNKGNRPGKTDYNFEWNADVYDGTDWSERKDGQPFFCQIQTPGGKRRGGTIEKARNFQQTCEKVLGSSTDVSQVTLPPYYPNDPVILQDWAAYLDTCRYTDHLVGEVVERLKKEGVYDNTVLLFMTDHGLSHARGKQFLYDEGIHVPLVIKGPNLHPAVRTDLVEHIDIGPLSLGLAGIQVPNHMEGRDILNSDYQPRSAVFSARDRCDETVEHLRSVRTHRFKYIRNYLPQRPLLQPCAYKDKKDILVALRNANSAGTLNELQQRLLFSPTRTEEELYDLQKDPNELNNLAGQQAYSKQLKTMRQQLADWEERTQDHGRMPEPVEIFDSDMKVYLNQLKKRSTPEHLKVVQDNIALMKKWAAEGK